MPVLLYVLFGKSSVYVGIIKFGGSILAHVDHRLRALWHRNTCETSKRLWPLTATVGISTGHILIAAESVVLQDRCFHSYDDELYAEADT